MASILARNGLRRSGMLLNQVARVGGSRFISTSSIAVRSTTTIRAASSHSLFFASGMPRVPRITAAVSNGSFTVVKRTIFIQTESTPNPDSLKFKPGRQVMESGTKDFPDEESAAISPLAANLYKIEGVNGVLFGTDFISINKLPDAEWQLMKPDIYATIMDFFSTNQPLFSEPMSTHTPIDDNDSELVKAIKELLDTRVRPVVQEDGGDIEYRGFEEGILYVKMQGSCSSCPSSIVTLKSGIENMFQYYIPEVERVEQVLDEIDKVSATEFEKLEQRIQNYNQQP